MKSTDNQIYARIESISEIEKKIEILKDIPQDFQIEMRLGLEIARCGDNELSVQLKSLYLYQNRPLVTYAVEYKYEFEDIESVVEFSVEIVDKRGVLPAIVDTVIGGLRGMLALSLKDTPYQDVILPYANPEMLLRLLKKEQ